MKSRAISSSSDVEDREYVPGEVDDRIYVAGVGERPLGLTYGLAGPVARVLLEAGEGIEDGALPCVGVPRQSVVKRASSVCSPRRCRVEAGQAAQEAQAELFGC